MQSYVAEATDIDLMCYHGEGPWCDPRTGEVLWVDGSAVTLNRFDPTVGPRSLRTATVGASVAGFARAHAAGGYVVVADSAVWHLPSFDEAPARLVDLPEPPGVQVNDGTVDPWGRLWAGTMKNDGAPGAASLWVWPGAGPARKVLHGITISNGLDWSPDASRAYYVDSTAQRIDVLHLEESRGDASGVPVISQREPLVAIDESAGIPDGLIVDDEGCIWLALWGGRAVHRYSPAGELLAVVEVPVTQPSAVCFAGADRDVLYITTSRQDLSAQVLADEPDAGRLFSCRIPGVTGPPARLFTPR